MDSQAFILDPCDCKSPASSLLCVLKLSMYLPTRKMDKKKVLHLHKKVNVTVVGGDAKCQIFRKLEALLASRECGREFNGVLRRQL